MSLWHTSTQAKCKTQFCFFGPPSRCQKTSWDLDCWIIKADRNKRPTEFDEPLWLDGTHLHLDLGKHQILTLMTNRLGQMPGTKQFDQHFKKDQTGFVLNQSCFKEASKLHRKCSVKAWPRLPVSLKGLWSFQNHWTGVICLLVSYLNVSSIICLRTQAPALETCCQEDFLSITKASNTLK